jgi:hypothetical protein
MSRTVRLQKMRARMRVRRPVLVAGCLLACTGIGWAQDCLERVGRAPHGIADAVAAEGTVAFLGNGAEVMVVSLDDPSEPAVIGSLQLPYYIRGLAIDGDRLYVSTDHHLHVVDIGSPSLPVELGVVTRWSPKNEIAASGNLVCLVEGTELVVVDASDPTAPFVAGSWSGATVTDVVVVGDSAFVTAGGSLRTIDLNDPTTPTQVGSLGSVSGHLAAAGNLLYASSAAAFKVIDISNPELPALVGSSNSVNGQDVAVAGDLAFVIADGIDVLDVSDPENPNRVGNMPWSHYPTSQVAAIVGYGIAGTGDHGFLVIDATTPTTPVETATVDSPGLSPSLAVGDSVLAVAQALRGLRTLDITDPTAPEELAILDLGWHVEGVDLVGDRAYVVGTGFAVVDIADPALPVLLGQTLPFTFSGFDVEVVGSTAFVAALSSGLVVVDVTDPTSPVEIGDLDFGDGEFEHIDVLGDIAVLRGPTIEVVDIEDPSNPVPLSTIDLTAGVTGGVALMGRWLLIPRGGTLHVFDVSDPSIPVEVAAYFRPHSITAIGVAGTVVYLGCGDFEIDNQVEAWDMGDPLDPVLMGSHGEAGIVTGIAFSDAHAFTARFASGVDIFSLCRGPIFADGFESGNTAAWSDAAP